MTCKSYTMKHITAKLKPWLIKLRTDRLPLLGEKFTHIPTPLCPICKLYKETPKNFLTCSYYTRDTDQQTQQLIQIMNKVSLDPYLRILICRLLKS